MPEDLKERCEEVREQLVEKLIDVDNELADSYLEGETITAEMLKRAIRRATIGLQFAPVCLGSAFKNKGVQPLLDAVIDYLPDPRCGMRPTAAGAWRFTARRFGIAAPVGRESRPPTRSSAVGANARGWRTPHLSTRTGRDPWISVCARARGNTIRHGHCDKSPPKR